MKVHSVAKFIVPEWGDKVKSGIGLSNRACQATWPGGLVRQPYAVFDFIPPLPGTKNLATVYVDKVRAV
jgi:hypothetical protein